MEGSGAALHILDTLLYLSEARLVDTFRRIHGLSAVIRAL